MPALAYLNTATPRSKFRSLFLTTLYQQDLESGQEKAKLQVVNFPGDPIHLFRGSKEDITDRITGFLPASTQGDGDFYRTRVIRALWAVIVHTSEPVPTNIEEILKRFRNGNSFVERPEDRAIFNQFD